MSFDNILFDLDGTLTDPAEGITNSIAYALEKFGIFTEDKKSLNKFIGPPLIPAFVEFCGLSEKDARSALGYYREYFVPYGMFENKLYIGIPEMLQTLCGMGKKLFVATSKPEPYARQIIEHFGISQHFEDICGSTLDERLVNKDDIIALTLSRNEISNINTSVMVGDRHHDILGAKKNALASVGVLYGYGDLKELSDAHADFIVASVTELFDILSK